MKSCSKIQWSLFSISTKRNARDNIPFDSALVWPLVPINSKVQTEDPLDNNNESSANNGMYFGSSWENYHRLGQFVQFSGK